MNASGLNFTRWQICASVLFGIFLSVKISAAMDGMQSQTASASLENARILTPVAPRTPRINGASIFGVRPGRPFLFQVPVTGDRPMEFSAENLPSGLRLDLQTGLLTGVAPTNAGNFTVTLRAKNSLGRAEEKFKIVVGGNIALTPPMGWNSWNCFGSAVDEAKVRSAAAAMIATGLINHGWTYINVDDFWSKNRDSFDPTLGGIGRDAQGCIVPNPRFPDMKALADYIHSQGLKMGIYSSPGPYTCGGCLGSFDHEESDAQSYAAWGVDYLKYDWCTYKPAMERLRGTRPDFSDIKRFWGDYGNPPRDELIKPYAVMRAALDKANRDIVFSLCQYGMGDVWEWGASVKGNCWRTTSDITDIWSSMASNGFGSTNNGQFAGPGHWNDPDMLVVGKLGWGKLRPTRLTPDEQYTHISQWCLLAAPLLIGCDVSQLDDFTLSLLSNDEVLAIDQDPLGKQASRIWNKGNLEIWAKDLADGSKAVGLFNRGELETTMELEWSELGIRGKYRVRDLWRQKDLGVFQGTFTSEVPRHGVVLIRLWPKPDKLIKS